MDETMFKNDLKEKQSEQEIFDSCKWRNVFFNKEGKGHRGSILWDSLAAAKGRVAEVKRLYPTGLVCLQTLDGELHGKDWVWTIQIPVLTQ